MISSKKMDKLKLAGQNLGRVFNFRHGHAFAPLVNGANACPCLKLKILISTKLTNLKWKAQPKQLKGSLPLAFVLPNKNKKKTF
jgi:hypothetical protein